VFFLYLYPFLGYYRFCAPVRQFFPTPPLVSPKFTHVPLELDGWHLGSEERRRWANCPCNQFPRFPTFVITIHQRYRRTDRLQTPCNPNTTLCTVVHHAVKMITFQYYYTLNIKLLFCIFVFSVRRLKPHSPVFEQR